jgi:hypothetical protein
MTHPAFFSDVPSIVMHDSLAKMLGASDDGLFTYNYIDAVRLAGHSCPTVAGAYLMTRRALQVLYPDAIPERGQITVSFSSPQDEGVTGVIASVASLITGAAGIGGFKGVGGQFSRKDLLRFGAAIRGEARFERIDTGAAVQLAMNMHRVPPQPPMMTLLQAVLSNRASADERQEFATMWQARVKRILIDHVDDRELIEIIA